MKVSRSSQARIRTLAQDTAAPGRLVLLGCPDNDDIAELVTLARTIPRGQDEIVCTITSSHRPTT